MRDLVQEQRLARDLDDASSRNTGLGMRAKEENSSTIRRRSPTWRTMVPVSRSNVSPVDVISLP
jgi:hypothetical protein